MTTAELRPRRRTPLAGPQVNAKAATAQVVPQDLSAAQNSLATAGASRSINLHGAVWDRCAVEAGILGFDLTPDATYLAATGTPGETWMLLLDPEVEGPESGEPTLRMTLLGNTAIPPAYPHRPPLAERVNAAPTARYRSARRHADRSRVAALDAVRRELDKTKASYALQSPRDVAAELGDELGVGQLVVARAIGVTPTAVRKWRRGEPARPEHRDRLAQLAALNRVLIETGLHDPAGWIDIPISSESTLTPLDLFTAGRADLVVLLASGLSDPHETLDALDSNWRQSHAPDSEYEVVTLRDGSRSVVSRQDARS